jgi:hypothetical protein
MTNSYYYFLTAQMDYNLTYLVDKTIDSVNVFTEYSKILLFMLLIAALINQVVRGN